MKKFNVLITTIVYDLDGAPSGVATSTVAFEEEADAVLCMKTMNAVAKTRRLDDISQTALLL